MADFRIGTCSWKYDSWKGLVYPEADKINYLKEYTKVYNTVEVDQWFWSLFEGSPLALPKTNVVSAYSASIPEDFKFTVKMPNSLTLTHYYNRSKSAELKENPHFFSGELLDTFMDIIEPLHNNLGPMMFQFEYLNKAKMSSMNNFLKQLGEFVKSFPEYFTFALEIRNPNYLKPQFFEFLDEYKISPVLLQGYYMPPVTEVYNSFKQYINTTTVIRLHGPDRSGIEKITGGNWNEIVQPKDSELPSIINVIKDLLLKDVDVYLNVNNHYEGSAPKTIDKINELFEMA